MWELGYPPALRSLAPDTRAAVRRTGAGGGLGDTGVSGLFGADRSAGVAAIYEYLSGCGIPLTGGIVDRRISGGSSRTSGWAAAAGWSRASKLELARGHSTLLTKMTEQESREDPYTSRGRSPENVTQKNLLVPLNIRPRI